MTYFNGTLHGFNSHKGYIAPVPTTKVYCDDCAVKFIPLDTTKPKGREHWDTDFKWAPHFGGKCHHCERKC